MRPSLSCSRWSSTLVLLALCWAVALPAQAEKADRLKKMEIESDQAGKVDLQNQRVVFSGNVVISKGSLLIRAARVEVHETSRGNHEAVAFSAPGKPVFFRQKRDGVDEFIEGEAERLEYDSRTDTVRFIDKAAVRRLRGSAVADEATGALIVYDAAAEVFTVSGGASAVTQANPTGRVRVVLSPREADAALPAASAASAGHKR
jgi:lipopolysaccharide export system protein LptA